MSSVPRTESSPGRRLRGPGRWSLRTRLIAAVLALIALVSLAIGAVSTVAMRQFLVAQLDNQLATAAARVGPERGGRGDRNPPDAFPPGQPAGTLSARLAGDEVVRAQIFRPDAEPNRESLAAEQYPVLTGLPVGAGPVTRGLGSVGSYRLVAVAAGNGEVVVTGLPLTDVERAVWWMVAVETALAVLGLAVAGTAGTLIVGGALRPLRRMAATATRVSELPLDRGEVALSVRVPERDTDPQTEVGQVGAALNRMLAHVAAALRVRQASETRVRQFVADASHELRTPLAAIRGYAELTRRAREEVPPQIAHALRRIESESLRMSTLVDDLLLLARLDSGRPLVVEPVDLTALVIDVVGDAHAAGPEHEWLLAVPEEAVLVEGDRARLHQVVANLLTNARAHTPAGTRVVTSLRAERDGGATITVSDTGPGIPAELRPKVFERFARGDTSRSRAAGSTGLGLAIVAAVVEAHGGAVGLRSRPGETTVTVRLPGSPPVADDDPAADQDRAQQPQAG